VRILQVHNQYRIRGGECRVVDTERTLLQRAGHTVELFGRRSADLEGSSALRRLEGLARTPWNRATARALAGVVRRDRPDVAHVHNVFPLISPSVYAVLAALGVPVVQTVHNFRLFCPNGLFFRSGQVCEECQTRGLFSAVRRRCLHGSFLVSAAYAGGVWMAWRRGLLRNAVTRFIALSQFGAERLVGRGLPPSRVTVLGNFVERFAEGPVRKGDYVLYLGRLSPEKGVMTLLEAAGRLPDMQLRIAGAGPLEDEIRRWVVSHPEAKVRLEGIVAGEVKERLIQEALCTVVPSECFESFGLSAAESLSLGTAVVATRMGGLPELVENGVTGVICEPGDPESLAGALATLVNERGRAEAMGKEAVASARVYLSPERHLRGLLGIYRRAVVAKGRAGERGRSGEP